MIPLCRYILQGGNQCQQAAINGENYCRHHLVVRRTVAANTPKPNPYRIEQPLTLVFPEDRAALMINIFVVMQAFNEGQIGPKSANIFTRLLHECSINLRQGPLYETDRENAVRRVVVTPEGEEIAPAREVPEEGEAVGEEAVSGEGEKVQGPGTGDQEDSVSSAGSEKAASGEVVSEEAVSEKATVKLETVPPGDFARSDPCYIENLTQRRQQYREFGLRELAAGRDPRAWEDFIPGKSRAPRLKTIAG